MQFIQNALLNKILEAVRGGKKGATASSPIPKEQKQRGFLDTLNGFVSIMSQLFGGARQFGSSLGKGQPISALFGALRVANGLGNMVGGGGGGGGGGGKNAAAAAAAGGGRGAMAAVGRLGAAGPIGIAVAAIAAAGVAAYAFGKELKKATENLIESNRKYAEIHAGMAALYAIRDLRELFRERDKASYLMGPTSRLIQQEQRFKDQAMPWEVVWEELKSGFLLQFYTTMTDMLTGVNDILKLLGAEFKTKPDASGTFGQMALGMAKKHNERVDWCVANNKPIF